MSTAASCPSAFAMARPSARQALPVTAHPLFPAILALWFAALLGLSSLVLAPALLERIVAASRIDTIIAAAAPPLGQTARLLLALGLAGLGGILGLIFGRWLAGRAPRAVSSTPHAVDQATEVDFGASLRGEPSLGLRDRLARLTGQGDGPRDFDDLSGLHARESHLDALGRKSLWAEDEFVAEMIAAHGFAVTERLPEADAAMPDDMDHEHAEVLPGAQDDETAVEDLALDLDAWFAEEPALPPGLPEVDSAPVPAPASALVAVEAIASARLDSLGVVQLTERLAIAMRERRARDAQRAEAAPAASGQADEPPIVLPSLVARRPEPPLPPPAQAQAQAEAEAEAEAPAPSRSEPTDLGRDALDSGYSSLLGLTRKPVAKAPIVPALHSAEPQDRPGPFPMPGAAAPVAVNEAAYQGAAAPRKPPGAADSTENYRALKAALASLHQISGTR